MANILRGAELPGAEPGGVVLRIVEGAQVTSSLLSAIGILTFFLGW